MKSRRAVLAVGLMVLLGFSACTFAEFYVINTPYDIYALHRHRRYHVKPHHYIHHRYVDLWKIRHRNCYDPDMTTGDDDPCMYPDMDIDE